MFGKSQGYSEQVKPTDIFEIGPKISESEALMMVANPQVYFEGTNFIPAEDKYFLFDDYGDKTNWSGTIGGNVELDDGRMLPNVISITPQQFLLRSLRTAAINLGLREEPLMEVHIFKNKNTV